MLLHNMALAIDAQQVAEKEEVVRTNVSAISDLKVYWRDNVCSDDKSLPRKIIYIPQSYLNRLSDVKEETTEIDSIVQDIVLQDDNARRLFQQMNDGISEHKQKIAKAVVDLIKIVADRSAIIEDMKEIGDKVGIKLGLEQLSSQLQQLTRTQNITEADINAYQEANEEVQRLTSMHKALVSERKVFASIDSVMQQKDSLDRDISVCLEKLTNAIDRTQIAADAHWLGERDEITKQIDQQIIEIEKKSAWFKARLTKLAPKIEQNEKLNQLSAAIAAEKEKQNRLAGIEATLERVDKKYDAQLAVLTGAFETFKSHYNTFVNGVNALPALPAGEMKFEVRCFFRGRQFIEKILGMLPQTAMGIAAGTDALEG